MPNVELLQFIAEACQGDLELSAALHALLAADDDEAGLLDVPIINFENNSLRPPRSFFEGEVVLGRFKILRYLAAGGMGEVYEAEDLFLQDLHVAMKTIRPNIAADPELRRRFKREVVLAREVSHPNLCPIYDIFQCDEPPPGFLFLTMKLLTGGTLTALLRSGESPSNEEKETILRQIALGLAAIHAAGIVHGGIKPNNIMLDRSGPAVRLGSPILAWRGPLNPTRRFQPSPPSLERQAISPLSCTWEAHLPAAAICSPMGWSCMSSSPAGSRLPRRTAPPMSPAHC
jgi:serine/threonine protein kinase